MPERYSARAVDGNVIDRQTLGSAPFGATAVGYGVGGAAQEAVTVNAQSPTAKRAADNRVAAKALEPSQNVINLQRRTSGVLPIRVDVPRAGTSHQFVKPLVVDQETVVKLRYKRR